MIAERVLFEREELVFHSIAKFYLDGFRSMQVGRSLWKIIILKLIIMFTVLKLFFPNFLQAQL